MEKQSIKDNIINPPVGQKKNSGMPERVANFAGVFLFYMLLFSVISVISRGFTF